MILQNLLEDKNILKEEFAGGITVDRSYGREYGEIFVNPTPQEMGEVAAEDEKGAKSLYIRKGGPTKNTLRFFAFPNKKLYVFENKFLHDTIATKFGFHLIPFTYIGGIARKENSKWNCVEAHNVMSEVSNILSSPENIKQLREFFNQDWSWANKYINVTNFLNSEEKRFRQLLLKEEFSQGVKVAGQYYEVYVNPSVREMDEVADRVDPKKKFGWDNAWIKYQNKEGQYLRFTALPNKKVYVFSPFLLHEDLCKTLGYNLKEDTYIHGVALKINGRWTAVEAHNIEFMLKHWHEPEVYKRIREELERFAKVDWSWINKYISISGLLSTFVKETKEKLGNETRTIA
jgi:hypothetical protein